MADTADTQQHYRTQLQAAQTRASGQRELESWARSIKKPSLLGYGVLLYLALVLDLLDLVELTGVGIIVSKIVQIFATIFFLSVSFYVSGKIKRMRKAGDALGQHMVQTLNNISQYRARYSRMLRFARKIPALRAPLRRAALSFKKVRMVASRNPVVKSIIANAIEFVPAVAILPMQTVEVCLMYRDHRSSYRQAQEILERARQIQIAEEEEFLALQKAEYEQLASRQLPQDQLPYAA